MHKISGQLRGIRTRPPTGKSTITEYYVGLSDNKKGGYPGEEVITEVRLPKSMVDDASRNRILQHVDKMVEVAVFYTARAYNGKPYVDFIADGEFRALPAVVAPVAKAG